MPFWVVLLSFKGAEEGDTADSTTSVDLASNATAQADVRAT